MLDAQGTCCVYIIPSILRANRNARASCPAGNLIPSPSPSNGEGSQNELRAPSVIAAQAAIQSGSGVPPPARHPELVEGWVKEDCRGILPASFRRQEPGFDRLSLTERTLACLPPSVIAAQAAIQSGSGGGVLLAAHRAQRYHRSAGASSHQQVAGPPESRADGWLPGLDGATGGNWG